MTPWPPRASDSHQSRLSPPASRLNTFTLFNSAGPDAAGHRRGRPSFLTLARPGRGRTRRSTSSVSGTARPLLVATLLAALQQLAVLAAEVGSGVGRGPSTSGSAEETAPATPVLPAED
jgi:hypothetical protein